MTFDRKPEKMINEGGTVLGWPNLLSMLKENDESRKRI